MDMWPPTCRFMSKEENLSAGNLACRGLRARHCIKYVSPLP